MNEFFSRLVGGLELRDGEHGQEEVVAVLQRRVDDFVWKKIQLSAQEAAAGLVRERG